MPRNKIVRSLMLIGLLTLVSALIVLPVFSQDDTESPNPKLGAIAALAEYAPADTLGFFAMRADQDFIDTLDALVAEALAALPPDTLPAHPSLSQLLDAGTASLFTVDFINGVRPWLGDAVGAAIGPLDVLIDDTYTNDALIPVTLYAQITDRRAAEDFANAFIQQYYEGAAWLIGSHPGYTLYSTSDGFPNVAIMVRDDVIILGTSADTLPLDGAFENSLNDNAHFNQVMATLPADNYAAVIYADVPTLMSYAYAGTPYRYMEEGERLLMAAALRMIGPMGAGATLIEEGDGAAQTWILDGVMLGGNYAGLEAFGLTFGDPGRVDPAFIANLPSDAALAMQGSNLVAGIDLLVDNYTALEPIIYPALFGVVADRAYSVSGSAAFLGAYNVFARYVTQIPGIVTGNLFGLDYDTEVRNWLGGDYALFFRANNDFDPMSYTAVLLALDFAFVSEAADAALSRQAIATLQRDLPITVRTLGATNVTFAQETIGTADALTMTIDALPSYMRETFQETSVDPDAGLYTLVIAANDTHFAFGTRRAVTDTLMINPLVRSTSPAFAVTHDTLLETDGAVYYASGPQLTRFIDAMHRMMGGNNPDYLRQTEIVRAVLLWLGEGTISSGQNENRDIIIRAALSITPPDVLEVYQTDFAALPIPERPTSEFVPTAEFVPTLVPTTAMMFPTLTPTPIIAPESTIEAEFPSLFAGLPRTRTEDGGFVIGSPDAPITFVVFFDYFCPHCQAYNESTLIPLIATYVAGGQAKVETRFMVTAGGERMTQMAAYAECIDAQSPGLYWDFSEAAFADAREGELTPATALEFAVAQRGLDVNVLQECVIDASQITTDKALADELGASSTPAVFVRYGDGFPEALPNGRDFADLVAVIEAAQD